MEARRNRPRSFCLLSPRSRQSAVTGWLGATKRRDPLASTAVVNPHYYSGGPLLWGDGSDTDPAEARGQVVTDRRDRRWLSQQQLAEVK